MNAKVRYSIASVAAAVEAMLLVTATARTAGAALPSVEAFAYTGSNQIYTVPAGVCGVRIEVEGAAGGINYYGNAGGHGGIGSAEFAVSPGDVLTVTVGGVGSHRVSSNDASWVNGGFGGGGQPMSNMAGGGGGATTVISGADTLIVAGGGGGIGYNPPGNPAAGNGGDVGQAGTAAADGSYGSVGGGGGTLTAGGAGGVGTFASGISGTRGNGGAASQWGNYGAGAGGGGYFGGGSGGAGIASQMYSVPAGGGGGSGFVASGATNVGTWSGHTGLGDGSAAITPTFACSSATTSTTATATTLVIPSTTVVADPMPAIVPTFTG